MKSFDASSQFFHIHHRIINEEESCDQLTFIQIMRSCISQLSIEKPLDKRKNLKYKIAMIVCANIAIWHQDNDAEEEEGKNLFFDFLIKRYKMNIFSVEYPWVVRKTILVFIQCIFILHPLVEVFSKYV